MTQPSIDARVIEHTFNRSDGQLSPAVRSKLMKSISVFHNS